MAIHSQGYYDLLKLKEVVPADVTRIIIDININSIVKVYYECSATKELMERILSGPSLHVLKDAVEKPEDKGSVAFTSHEQDLKIVAMHSELVRVLKKARDALPINATMERCTVIAAIEEAEKLQ